MPGHDMADGRSGAPAPGARFDPFKPHDYLIARSDHYIWLNGPQRHLPDNLPAEHSHNGWYELVIVAEGSAEHVADGEAAPVAAGMTFLIPPGSRHYYRDAREFVIYNILFQAWFLDLYRRDLLALPGGSLLFMKNGGALELDPAWLPRLIARCHTMWQLVEHPEQPGERVDLAAHALELLLTVCRHCVVDGQPGARMRNAYAVSRIVDYLDHHFTADVSLAELAAKFAMSVSVFRKKFRAVTGVSAIDYLINLRLRHAMTLLLEKSLPISAVALRSGFGDSNYFTRQFHLRFGMTPSRFAGLDAGEQQRLLQEGAADLVVDGPRDRNAEARPRRGK